MNNKTRGAAMRAQRRQQDDANKIIDRFTGVKTSPGSRANTITNSSRKLKLTFLGGLEDVGEKNMAVIEYGSSALILDCGFNLSIDLPGVNYEICDTSYLNSIKHKLKGYVITHGHLDHIGGLKHIVPQFPAPIFGSRFTMGIIEKTFADELAPEHINFKPELVSVSIDSHSPVQIGEFKVEFIRVTHAIPDPAAICIETPAGRIVATGDFRLDPEPLDNLHTDVKRLRELGDKGVLVLLSESSYANIPGRTPTEHTLQQSFYDIIDKAEGRIFVAVFSSNINRTQMIINAAAAAGRKVALDGRSMLAYAEIAVRQGILKVPKGTIVPLQQISSLPVEQVLVMCTGGQGEPNAALQRMSLGEHKYVKLAPDDTVVVSSSPIPGNEVSYDQISNRLKQAGVHLYRHPTHEVDGCGPLHVSGHAKRDELREMLQLIRPKFFVPVHGGFLRRSYHAELAIEEGVPRANTLVANNGDSLFVDATSMELGEPAQSGGILIDQNGAPVEGIVIKDRLLLSESGIFSVVLTIDSRSGKLLTSPDIISRGCLALRDNDQLMNELRIELRRAVQQRYKRIELQQFKQEIREFVTHFLFVHTGQSPIVIPVVNLVGGKPATPKPQLPAKRSADQDQERFQEMRAKLLAPK